MKRALVFAALVAACVLAGSAGIGRAATAGYTITDLGSLGGSADGTDPHAINSFGEIAGEATDTTGTRRAFLWTPTSPNGSSGAMSDLGDLGAGRIAIGEAIDDSGDVVGIVSFGTDSHAFFKGTGKMIDLGPGEALGLGGGTTVGQAYGSAVFWSAASASSRTTLGTLGGVQAGATAANANGEIAGWRTSPTYPFPVHAVLFGTSPGVTDLGTLGGPSSFANAINASGDVVGYSSPDNTTNSHAFLWRLGGGMIDLGALGYNRGSSSESRAYGVNDADQVVGQSYGFDFREHAFLWQDGTMTNLDTLLPAGSGWQLQRASAINDAGQIVGFGLLNGRRHGYLLTPAAAADDTPPVSTASVSPAANAAGWNNRPVTVTISASDGDGGSGVASITYSTGGAPTTVAAASVSVPVTAEGVTTVAYHATDNAGNVESDHAIAVRIDETAPVVSVPAGGLTADATSTDGATVDYRGSVAVTDNLDPSPALDCAPPAGSVFATGETPVSCVATDRAGNASTATFTVTVRGAADQIADELTNPSGGLAGKQQAAFADVQGANTQAACGVLDAYGNEVRALTGKKLTVADAATLLATVGRVDGLLGC
ncbi:MAG TPA: HYR domain-containing protein [Gaiellaceae bacterium]|nr:HYR domain-containing protein [Gaiellaceae bacterium]